MAGELDFSLPERKKKNNPASWIIVVLLLILTGLSAADFFQKPGGTENTGESAASSFSAERTKQLAGKLSQRNLYTRAAEVWRDYLAVGPLADGERARILFQIGTLLEKAGDYDQAIEYFYRSEIVAKLDELKPQINAHIKDCFEQLGKFSALRYELMDRTSMETAPAAGSKVVAEIGPEKITEADLDAAIENNIENQLQPMAPFMTAEQFNAQKTKMLEQYKNPQARQQYLQAWLAQEVLYRQALQEGLPEKPEAKKLINDLTRGALSQLLMNRELASKINITETDIQTYYTANKDKFIEPATARIGHILVDDEQKAKDLIDRIKGGEDFGELAKQFTQDESTKDSGGKIDADVSKGAYIPGIGTHEELNKKIFAVSPPAVLDEPLKTDKGWEVVKVETIAANRQKSLDEVRQEVMSMLANQKCQDVQRDYLEKMMDEQNVIIHTSALGGTGTETVKTPAGAAK